MQQKYFRSLFYICTAALLSLAGCAKNPLVPNAEASRADEVSTDAKHPPQPPEPKLQMPMHLAPSSDGFYRLPDPRSPSRNITLTLNPEIQYELESFVTNNGNPISSLVMAEVKTGRVLAMVQGRDPENWGGKTHTALHAGFPAASLFKTVITATAVEFGGYDIYYPVGLRGSCGNIPSRPWWLEETGLRASEAEMTIARAYGRSCNGFFAKMAINYLGLGGILTMAERFGWNNKNAIMASDFIIPKSPFAPPNPGTSSVHTVGEFAAGYGRVGLSAMHAAWQTMAVANDGQAKPLLIRNDSAIATPTSVSKDRENILFPRLVSTETAEKIRQAMTYTITAGTASFAFRRGKYKNLRHLVGGKTGTLTGDSPEGLTTWFIGAYPINRPEVVVASVVMLEDHWRFKAPHLAAEAISLYYEKMQQNQQARISMPARSKRRR